jgi:hypothetical protein
MRTPLDLAMIEQARRRGGEKAAKRVAWAIRVREIKNIMKRNDERKALIQDDGVDHAWKRRPRMLTVPLGIEGRTP